MPKHIPSDEYNETLVRGDAVGALKDAGAKRSNTFDLDIEQIAILPDFNPRVSGTKDHEAHINALADSILANGFLPNKPLSVFPAEETVEGSDEKVTVFYIIDGHSRFEAVRRANEKGAGIETLPVSILPKSDLDNTALLADLAILTVLNNNSTRPLTPVELAIVVKRLVGYETPKADIAKRLGITARYVDDLLVLHEAPPAVQEAVRAGEVSATLAISELRQHGEKAATRIQAAVEKAKAAGKKKVTPKQMPKAAPSKTTGKAAAKAKIAKAAETAKAPTKKPAKTAPAEATDPIATDVDFMRGAIEYALAMPKKGGAGLEWLAKFMADDAVAIGELESWLGQPKGAFFDASLRGPVDKDAL
jgi:ParB family chromosome partitioning protein